MVAIRVLIADDNEITRWGIKAIIESSVDIEVAAEAGDGQEAVDLAVTAAPDVALLDASMPRLDGIAAARAILALPLAPRVAVLTAFHDDTLVHRAVRAGVSGFLLKDTAPPELLNAVREFHRGHRVLGPAVARRLIDHLSEHTSRLTSDERRRLDALTPRERRTLALLARGLTNAEVGTGLGVGEGTVKGRVSLILDKLGVDSRVQAAHLAHRAGIAVHDEP
ncbi:response regulator [Streptomyces kronopolitis]|uniref:response regulator n=1 Tax=Streptomyces kronopolitis TaxID=1612435 RepID=UPI003D96219C